MAFFAVFVINHAENIGQFGQRLFLRLHQGMASRNRGNLGKRKSIFLTIKNYFVIFHAHNRIGYMPRCSSWLSSLCFLQFLGECGHDFKNVAHYAVIGDLKNRGIRILVDRDNGARALHPDYVLDGPADA